MTPVTRRTFVTGLIAAGALTLTGCFPRNPSPIDTRGAVPFGSPLLIPPLAPATEDADGTVSFALEARSGSSAFFAGRETPTLGFNGSYLGPTLRVPSGSRVRIDMSNSLSDSTTVHWHGMKLPAEMDGGPHQLVAAGGDWHPHWDVDQPAATLWYHPHMHGDTERHVLMGMAGLFLVDDDSPVGRELPHDYGVDDVPVILQDKNFTADYEIDGGGRPVTGYIGDTILVNGVVGPFFTATTSRLRLRMLNAATARFYNLALDDRREFALIATDGGLLPAPIPVESVLISPGERVEIVIDIVPGEPVRLQSLPHDLGMGTAFHDISGASDALDLLEIRPGASLSQSNALPVTLAPPPDTAPGGVRREFVLNGRSINGRSMQLDQIDLIATAGTTETWIVRNTDSIAHNFHVHDTQFVVRSADGAESAPELRGWKDTVYIPPRGEVELAVPIGSNPSERWPYMFHCHLLWHEDQGMMGQFLVVEAGREQVAPRTIPAPDHGH